MSRAKNDDPYDLRRFVSAQEGTYSCALRELQAGLKRSHWMWFVFPQMRGLGRSPTTLLYGIASLAEAQAYLAHPMLGSRLAEATRAVLAHKGRPLDAIFGSPDDLKFQSSMTLFAKAVGESPNDFSTALECFCGGLSDGRTLDLLKM